MRMRIASFNVENLFDLAKALALTTWGKGKGVSVCAHARLKRRLPIVALS